MKELDDKNHEMVTLKEELDQDYRMINSDGATNAASRLPFDAFN